MLKTFLTRNTADHCTEQAIVLNSPQHYVKYDSSKQYP